MICDGCFKRISSGDKYVYVSYKLVGELNNSETYCGDCATIREA